MVQHTKKSYPVILNREIKYKINLYITGFFRRNIALKYGKENKKNLWICQTSEGKNKFWPSDQLSYSVIYILFIYMFQIW